jgi:hypothetical protein
VHALTGIERVAGAVFDYRWAVTAAPCEDELSTPAIRPEVPVSLGVLSAPGSHMEPRTNDVLLGLPANGPSSDRDAVWSQDFKSARLDDGDYCVLLTGCTRPGIELPSRCKNATSLPITLERSPPQVCRSVGQSVCRSVCLSV